MPKVLNYKVLVEQDEDGVFVASVPDMPGCHSQGDTYEQAIKNTEEVVRLCLEVANDYPVYKSKINFPDHTNKSRFLGVTEIVIQL